jgi:hypothetical protein
MTHNHFSFLGISKSNSVIDGKSPYIGSIGWTIFPYMPLFNIKSGKIAGHLSIYDLPSRSDPDMNILRVFLWKTRRSSGQKKTIG